MNGKNSLALKETTNAKTNKIKAQINLIAQPGRTERKEKRLSKSEQIVERKERANDCCVIIVVGGEERHDKNLRL